jgi:hypothetical protein
MVAATNAPKSKEMQAARNENVYIATAELDAALAELDMQQAIPLAV